MLSSNWVLDSGSAPCHTSCIMQQFLESNQIPTIPQPLYSPDHVTYNGSQDSRLDSEVFILHLQKKINRMQLQGSQQYNYKTFRGSSSNSRTFRASVYMRAGSTLRMTRLSHVLSIFTTNFFLSSRNIVIFPHIIGMTKSQCMKYTEHVECKEEMRNSHKSLVRKPEWQEYARLMHR